MTNPEPVTLNWPYEGARSLDDLGEVSILLEQEADSLVKRSLDWKSNTAGSLVALAGLLALGGGSLGYHWAKSRSPQKILEEAMTNPEILKKAPHNTPVSRLDEVQAARKPDLRWKKA